MHVVLAYNAGGYQKNRRVFDAPSVALPRVLHLHLAAILSSYAYAIGGDA